MKSLRILMSVALLGILITYSNCGGSKNPEPPIQEVQLGKLSKAWKLTSVTLDGANRNTEYGVGGGSAFSLTISGSPTATSYAYTTANRPSLSPWKGSGSWTFGTDPATQVIRDPDNSSDKLDMTYSVNETQLQITFTFNGNGYPNSREEVVKGTWIFTFGL